jgi:hypothetical protein
MSNETNNPIYRASDPREGWGGTIRGKAAIYRAGDGESLVMINVRFDWSATPSGPEVTAFVLDPLPADVDDLEADLYESVKKALGQEFIANLKIVKQ